MPSSLRVCASMSSWVFPGSPFMGMNPPSSASAGLLSLYTDYSARASRARGSLPRLGASPERSEGWAGGTEKSRIHRKAFGGGWGGGWRWKENRPIQVTDWPVFPITIPRYRRGLTPDRIPAASVRFPVRRGIYLPLCGRTHRGIVFLPSMRPGRCL